MTTSVTPTVLLSGFTLATGNSVLLTGAVAVQTIIKRAVFANITAGAVTYVVTRTASGGSGLVVIPQRSIAAFGTDLAPELSNMVLNPGDELLALASAATSVNVFIFGFVAS